MLIAGFISTWIFYPETIGRKASYLLFIKKLAENPKPSFHVHFTGEETAAGK